MSKWINELMEITEVSASTWDWDILPILERVDKLLRKAALSVENPLLYEEIRKELDDV